MDNSVLKMKSMISGQMANPLERKETTLSDIKKEPAKVKTDEKWGDNLRESILEQKREEEEEIHRQRRGSNSSSRSRRSVQKVPNEQASFVSDEEGDNKKKNK